MNIHQLSIKNCFITIFSLLIFNSAAAREQYPYLFEKRCMTLEQHCDSLIHYTRQSATGSMRGTEGTGYIIHKKKDNWILEHYRWNNSTGKLISKYRTKKMGSKINSLFKFRGRNIDTLSTYNGWNYLHDIYNKRLNDTATEGRIYGRSLPSHYSYQEYYIKTKDKMLSSRHTSGTVESLLKEAPLLGALILVLNSFYYEYQFDSILDSKVG